MRVLVAAAFVLGVTRPALGQGAPCPHSALEHLKGSGFAFTASCEQQGDDLLVTVIARPGAPAETPAGIRPKFLTRLKLSFAGVLVSADAPPGYDVATELREQPNRFAVVWSRTADADGRVERGEAGFVVRLRGPDAGITCPHEFSTDTIAGGVTCGIPPSPSNTRVEPAATAIRVAFQHLAAAAHARGR
jgi:hypothetical protein